MPWLSCIVSNVLLASLLALAAWFMQRWLRRHAIAHVLWILVLVKLVTPPLVSVRLQETPGNTACQNGTCSCGPHVFPAKDGVDGRSITSSASSWMLSPRIAVFFLFLFGVNAAQE